MFSAQVMSDTAILQYYIFTLLNSFTAAFFASTLHVKTKEHVPMQNESAQTGKRCWC